MTETTVDQSDGKTTIIQYPNHSLSLNVHY